MSPVLPSPITECPVTWLLKKIGKQETQDSENRKNRKLCIKKYEKNRKINSTFVDIDSLPAPHQGYNKG